MKYEKTAVTFLPIENTTPVLIRRLRKLVKKYDFDIDSLSVVKDVDKSVLDNIDSYIDAFNNLVETDPVKALYYDIFYGRIETTSNALLFIIRYENKGE
jgi:hypothetical protein